MKIKGTHLLVLVAMCGLIASGVGLVTNVAGLFFDPVATELGILKGQVSMTLTICNICFALGGMLTPKLMVSVKQRLLVIVATAVLAASTAALTLCHGLVSMYALCVLRGLAAGVVGMVFATSVLNNWFVAGIGLATSIAFGCSGIAGAVFSPILSGIIQSSGWRFGYLVVAALTVVLNLPAIFFLPAVRPEECGLKALGATEAPAASAAKSDATASKTSAASISAVLFALVFAYAVICSALTGLPQHFPGMVDGWGLGAATGATMLSVCMVANTGGKVAFGALADKIGAKRSILAFCVAVFVGLIILLYVRTSGTMLIAAALFGLCYALATVGISMTVRSVFGVENYTRVYPTCSLGGNLANASFSSIIGFMYDFSGGYDSTLYLLAALTIATVAVTIVAYAKQS